MTTRLKRVADLAAGGTPQVDDPAMWDALDGTPWVSIGDMTRSSAIVETDRRVSALGVQTRRLPLGQPGTVLFAMYASVGEIGTLATEATWNQAIVGVFARDGRSDSRFIAYWLEHLRPTLSALFRSNTQDNLNAEQVGNLPFPELSVDEQRRIADFLDAETAQLDSVQHVRDKQMLLLESRETSALSKVFDDLAVEPIRLGYLARLQSGVTVGGSRPTIGLVERPYLRVANVKEDHLELGSVTTIHVTAQEARASRLRMGDVLMTEGGDLDKLGRGTVWRDEIVGCLHQNHVFALRCGPRLVPDYLAYFTRAASARAYFAETGVKTTNLASTNSTKVRNLPVPLPSVEAQQDCVRQIGRTLSTIGDLKESLDQQARLVAERRQALITAAVTGQLDVTTARGVRA